MVKNERLYFHPQAQRYTSIPLSEVSQEICAYLAYGYPTGKLPTAKLV